jgi:hypothetical protein
MNRRAKEPGGQQSPPRKPEGGKGRLTKLWAGPSCSPGPRRSGILGMTAAYRAKEPEEGGGRDRRAQHLLLERAAATAGDAQGRLKGSAAAASRRSNRRLNSGMSQRAPEAARAQRHASAVKSGRKASRSTRATSPAPVPATHRRGPGRRRQPTAGARRARGKPLAAGSVCPTARRAGGLPRTGDNEGAAHL